MSLVVGRCVKTTSFKKPHKNKSGDVMSGEHEEGQLTGPSRPIHLSL